MSSSLSKISGTFTVSSRGASKIFGASTISTFSTFSSLNNSSFCDSLERLKSSLISSAISSLTFTLSEGFSSNSSGTRSMGSSSIIGGLNSFKFSFLASTLSGSTGTGAPHWSQNFIFSLSLLPHLIQNISHLINSFKKLKIL